MTCAFLGFVYIQRHRHCDQVSCGLKDNVKEHSQLVFDSYDSKVCIINPVRYFAAYMPCQRIESLATATLSKIPRETAECQAHVIVAIHILIHILLLELLEHFREC